MALNIKGKNKTKQNIKGFHLSGLGLVRSYWTLEGWLK